MMMPDVGLISGTRAEKDSFIENKENAGEGMRVCVGGGGGEINFVWVDITSFVQKEIRKTKGEHCVAISFRWAQEWRLTLERWTLQKNL